MKSKRQLDAEIESYMLVDNRTGKDMRPAYDFEVADLIRRPRTVGMLELGNQKAKLYEVRLRNMKAPKRASGNPTLPDGVTIRSRSFSLGTLDGGKLYHSLEYGSWKALEPALAKAKALRWRNAGGVIIEDQQLAKQGTIYGSRQILHSIIDGQILPEWGYR